MATGFHWNELYAWHDTLDGGRPRIRVVVIADGLVQVAAFVSYIGDADDEVVPKSALDFTSKDFSYTSTPGKKDGWTVTIKPNDYKEVQQITLSISSEGYATLQVTSTNRQAISFNGMIAAPRQK